MTVDERQRVERLAKVLYPNDIFTGNCSDGPCCPVCNVQRKEWEATLWTLYNALIEAEFSI